MFPTVVSQECLINIASFLDVSESFLDPNVGYVASEEQELQCGSHHKGYRAFACAVKRLLSVSSEEILWKYYCERDWNCGSTDGSAKDVWESSRRIALQCGSCRSRSRLGRLVQRCLTSKSTERCATFGKPSSVAKERHGIHYVKPDLATIRSVVRQGKKWHPSLLYLFSLCGGEISAEVEPASSWKRSESALNVGIFGFYRVYDVCRRGLLMPLDLSSCFSSNGREMVPIVCDGKRDGIVLDAETSMPLRFYQPSSSHYFIPCLSDAVANGPIVL